MEATPNAVCDMEAKPNAVCGDHGGARSSRLPLEAHRTGDCTGEQRTGDCTGDHRTNDYPLRGGGAEDGSDLPAEFTNDYPLRGGGAEDGSALPEEFTYDYPIWTWRGLAGNPIVRVEMCVRQ